MVLRAWPFSLTEHPVLEAIQGTLVEGFRLAWTALVQDCSAVIDSGGAG